MRIKDLFEGKLDFNKDDDYHTRERKLSQLNMAVSHTRRNGDAEEIARTEAVRNKFHQDMKAASPPSKLAPAPKPETIEYGAEFDTMSDEEKLNFLKDEYNTGQRMYIGAQMADRMTDRDHDEMRRGETKKNNARSAAKALGLAFTGERDQWGIIAH